MHQCKLEGGADPMRTATKQSVGQRIKCAYLRVGLLFIHVCIPCDERLDILRGRSSPPQRHVQRRHVVLKHLREQSGICQNSRAQLETNKGQPRGGRAGESAWVHTLANVFTAAPA